MYQTYVVAGVLVLVLVLLATDRLRYDITALLCLSLLGASRVLSSAELTTGFGHPALFTVAAMSVMSAAFQKTALLRQVARALGKIGQRPVLLAATGTLVVAGLSAVMNNVAAISLAIPIIASVARKHGFPLAKFMMPLAFGSLVGGTMTLIGSPPNLLASGFLQDKGLLPLSFFELLPLGGSLVVVTVLYFATIGYRMLPRGNPSDQGLVDEYRVSNYIAEVEVSSDCQLAGLSIVETPMSSLYDARVLTIIRGGQGIYAPGPSERILPGDILQLEVGRDNLVALAGDLGVKIVPQKSTTSLLLEPGKAETWDAVVTADSLLNGKTLRQINFRRRFGVSVLAIKRRDESMQHRLVDLPLQGGDVLLLLGHPEKMMAACRELDLVLLGQNPVTRTRADLPVLITFGGIILSVSMGWLPLPVAALIAVVVTGILQVLSLEELYRAIPWPVLVLLGSMFGLATAAEKVGTSSFLAQLIHSTTGGNPLLILALLYALTAALTAVLINAAAFMLIAPVAMALASTLGADPRPFLIITVAGAASAFFSPVGHQSNALVYSAGNYRFADYARVGVILSLLVGTVCLLLVPNLWPLFPQ